ncbi:MAG: polyprenyl synthetase family protein [Firmicutes bacterium]|jgi:geranylgeranyl diphosphate synthase type II|nr:polyprenyl synthetase family protein [Bacillota bacterium]
MFQNYYNKSKETIDNHIQTMINPSNDFEKVIVEAMNYSYLSGGKRLRPVMTLEAFKLFNDNIDKNILDFASAIEMIHCYSLIHDDLPAMDNDDLRRGRATNHIKFDEATAILAGDGLLNYASETIFKTVINSGYKKEYVDAGYLLMESSGYQGMISGQVIDITTEDRQISKEELEYIHNNKTSKLIKASLLCGTIIGQGYEYNEIINSYGEKIGLAFQIIDDILDIESTKEVLGKSTGKDEDSNKNTFPKLYGLAESKIIARELIESSKTAIKDIDKNGFFTGLADYIINRKY